MWRRWIKLLLTIGITTFLIQVFNTHQPFGSSIPAIGKLLNPFSGFWQNAEAINQPAQIDLQLPELKAPVEVLLDEHMVPHIFADNIEDALFVQGYLEAKNRLWQMDFTSRAVAGRISEIIGQQAATYDQGQRRKGLFQAAKNIRKSWSANTSDFKYASVYAKGVNAYINELSPKDYPLEFKLQTYKPEQWTITHTALAMMGLAETLCFRNYDVQESNALALWGEEGFKDLYPEYNPEQSPIIPHGTPWDFEVVQEQAPNKAAYLSDYYPIKSLLPQSDDAIGSNNWAVAGAKTASGNTILCNDPHLPLRLPSIWYELHIHTPELNVYGVSVPGIPGVIIGFNEKIAWGLTNASHDILDWYELEWVDEAKTIYRLDGKEKKVQYKVDTIVVRNAPTILDTIKYTFWGPIAYEADDAAHKDLAMHWLVNEERPAKSNYELGVIMEIGQASNFDEFQRALTHFEAPAQNFAFASNSGDIGIVVNGKFPLRKKGQGRFVQKGNTTENAWMGYIPMEHVPSIKNPERGFIASANQHSTAPDYPYYYYGRFNDYRGRYIDRVLEEGEKLTVEDMKNLQLSAYSIKAEEGLPALLKFLSDKKLGEEEKAAYVLLEQWNYQFDSNEQAPVLFHEWFNKAFELTFDEIKEDNIRKPETWRFIQLLEETPNHPVFDLVNTPEKEVAKQIVSQAFEEICAEWLPKLLSGELDWNKYRNTRIKHLFRLDPFSSDVLVTNGYKEAPNAITNFQGPSWRMIVEFEQPLKAYGIYPGGQSGNPGSPFFDNRIEPWSKGTYNNLQLVQSPGALQGPILQKMNLRPE